MQRGALLRRTGIVTNTDSCDGPGSAERHEECRTASWTRLHPHSRVVTVREFCPPVHLSATVGMQQLRCPLGESRVMRMAVAGVGLLMLGGCAAEAPLREEPAFYLSMAHGG